MVGLREHVYMSHEWMMYELWTFAWSTDPRSNAWTVLHETKRSAITNSSERFFFCCN